MSTTAARSLVRLPAGNQVDVLATLHRDELTAAELDGVVDLLLAPRGHSQEEYILAQPRPALQQARQQEGWAWDPRLSQAGNRVARRLAGVLDGLGRMEVWLQSQGRAGLTPCGGRSLVGPARASSAKDGQQIGGLRFPQSSRGQSSYLYINLYIFTFSSTALHSAPRGLT